MKAEDISQLNAVKGSIFDIHRASLQDGPGLRTTVFFKGCQLRCAWCHNPESWTLEPTPIVKPTGSRDQTVYGYETSVGEIMAVVRRDKDYYETSGGGLTLSGGEPTLQFAFCKALLMAAHAEGIHTCLDTCGFWKTDRFLELLPYVDLYHYDYKATGTETHQRLTGSSDELILKNLDTLYQHGANIILRCPMIPRVNDTPEHLVKLGEMARQYPRITFDILPYHDIGDGKYDQIGWPRPSLNSFVPDADHKRQWKEKLSALGVTQLHIH